MQLDIDSKITSTPTPDVSVLIINYNGMHFLSECLKSLKSAFNSYTYEIVVVDNASQDGSQQYLKDRKDIVYIESTINTGFTGGNNIAAKHASGRVLLLLNNDTKVETTLDPVITQALQANVGVVGCRLVYGDKRTQPSIGYDHTPLRIVLSWMGLEKLGWLPTVFRRSESKKSFYDKAHSSVDWVSGACFATRNEVWKKLNGLDEKIFMYCEDVDYCVRARQIGLTVSYTEKSLVTHFEGSGRLWVGEKALVSTMKSYMHLQKKHGSKFGGVFLRLSLALVHIARSLALLMIGGKLGKEKASAYLRAARCLAIGH